MRDSEQVFVLHEVRSVLEILDNVWDTFAPLLSKTDPIDAVHGTYYSCWREQADSTDIKTVGVAALN